MQIKKEIAKFNYIKYYDKEHRYFDGEEEYISGTTFISLFKEKFDSDKQSKAYAKRNGMEQSDVLTNWGVKRDYAGRKGTYIHEFAENYWKNKVFDSYLDYDIELAKEHLGDEYIENEVDICKKQIIDFYNDAKENIIPIELELVVADKESKIAGMVDKLVWNEKVGEYQIWDYKTNKEINMNSKYNKRMKTPIQFIRECEFETYSIQLNLYKYIIEKNTDIKIGDMYLIWITAKNDKYTLIKCKDYQAVIEKMIKHYMDGKI